MSIPNPIFIIVMGVSGAGKSTLGAALAKEIGLPYVDGDDLHPKENIDKMSRGIPLEDDDRWPWLQKIRQQATDACKKHDANPSTANLGVVVGCSALKRSYRAILRGGESFPKQSPGDEAKDTSGSSISSEHNPVNFLTAFVFISGSRDELFQRMKERKGHYMKESMLESQLATLETPDPATEEGIIIVDLLDPTEVQVQKALKGLSALS